jgi:hypothetical protein
MPRNTALVLVCCGVTAIASQAQNVFQAINVPGAGAPSYFEIGADTGSFQIDDAAFPSLPNNTTALIATPAGKLTFSIGVGTPCVFSYDFGDPFPNPFIPPPPPSQFGAPLEVMGEYFSGSFQSSADVYADLMAGLGEFQVGSGRSSPVKMVAAPEPGSAVLFMCGVVLLVWRSIKRVVMDCESDKPRGRVKSPAE